jgi:hypothetical protein
MTLQIKSGKILSNSISRLVMNKINACMHEDLNTIEKIMNHSALEENQVHNLLLKLGFLAEKVSSQGYKYTLGPFSTTYHPAHAASANAGKLHPDFLSQLRRIFWALGFDKELLESFQKRFKFKASQIANNSNSSSKTNMTKKLKNSNTASAGVSATANPTASGLTADAGVAAAPILTMYQGAASNLHTDQTTSNIPSETQSKMRKKKK